MTEITDAGFEIVRQKEMTLTKENVELLYEAHKEKDTYEALVTEMTAGPCLVLCLARENAIRAWRDHIDAQEGAAEEESTETPLKRIASFVNVDDVPESPADVAREREILFGNDEQQAIAVIKPDGIEKSTDIVEQLKSVGFEIQEMREVEMTKEVASKIYAGKSGEPFFDDLVNHMTEGTCKVLVLSDTDAINKLRDEIGPVDPEEAKQPVPIPSEPNSHNPLFKTRFTPQRTMKIPNCTILYFSDPKLYFYFYLLN